MVNVEAITTPAALHTAADLRAYIHLNDQGEDTLLAELLAAAAERFQDDTRRPILTTTFRQYLARWPVLTRCHPASLAIVLGRGGATAVAGVKRFLADGTSTDDVTGYVADLKTTPARVLLATLPTLITSSAGVPMSPVGYVEFAAGWANAGAVPASVKVAVKSLAAHWYTNREAFTEKSLGPLEQGWGRVKAQYRLGLSGEWEQGA